MPATRTLTLGERLVTVRELTVGEVRDWLRKTETDTSPDILHALALPECNLADLVLMSDADSDALDACTPSELLPLYELCKELNPHFFRVREALSRVSRVMVAEAAQMISTAPPASS